MPTVRVYSLRPFIDLDGHFIDIEGQPTFDPKHPCTYPGAEVEVVETLPVAEAVAKYGPTPDEPYQVHNSGSKNAKVTILRLTGKTSKDIVEASL